ncbi:MAG: Tex-like N-terminal domain-containing protein, partial [Bacteroidota bacterium]
MSLEKYSQKIARKLGLRDQQVKNTLGLLASGGTIPFISRYRKEVTGSLDEVQITAVRDNLQRLQELDKRREAIIKSLQEQEILTAELQKQLEAAETLTILEDIYLPYKPKRKTRASVALSRGLEPLAKWLLHNNNPTAEVKAREFVNPGKEITGAEEALRGARDIIAEWVSENKTIRSRLRKMFYENGEWVSSVIKSKQGEAAKYETYFDYSEQVKKLPSHRILAMLRGEQEGFLRLHVRVDEDEALRA